jgi:hypothetical protein
MNNVITNDNFYLLQKECWSLDPSERLTAQKVYQNFKNIHLIS